MDFLFKLFGGFFRFLALDGFAAEPDYLGDNGDVVPRYAGDNGSIIP